MYSIRVMYGNSPFKTPNLAFAVRSGMLLWKIMSRIFSSCALQGIASLMCAGPQVSAVVALVVLLNFDCITRNT